MQNSTVTVNTANDLTFSPSIGTFNVGGLAGTANLALADTNGSAIALSVGGNDASTTYAGSPERRRLAGEGRQRHADAQRGNTYGGSTTVSAGTLRLLPAPTAPVSGATLWLDGTDPNGNGTLPANGAQLATWVNKGSAGSAMNFTGPGTSGANQDPTFTTSGIDGKPDVLFTRTGTTVEQYLEANNAAVGTLQSGAHTFFIVARANSGTEDNSTNTAAGPSDQPGVPQRLAVHRLHHGHDRAPGVPVGEQRQQQH